MTYLFLLAEKLCRNQAGFHQTSHVKAERCRLKMLLRGWNLRRDVWDKGLGVDVDILNSEETNDKSCWKNGELMVKQESSFDE